MSNILYFRCVDHVQLMSTINNLKILVEKYPRVFNFLFEIKQKILRDLINL